jgi:hypothetical protein
VNDPIVVEGKTYQHHSLMRPGPGKPSPLRDEKTDRQSFFKEKKKLRLDNTAGAYVPTGKSRILFVIDKNSVPFDSPEWGLIADTAQRLETCYPALSKQAQAALANLRAVVFSSKMARSYADVKPDIFFYDSDEFRRSDGSLVTPAWTTSCIVHDANHVWQHDNGQKFQGEKAEVVCWQLQVDNGPALGLADVEIDHLKRFIADPAKIIARMNSKTF